MRRSGTRITALLLALTAIALTLAVPRALARAESRRGEESTCFAEGKQRVSPQVLLTGETVTATVPITTLCAAEVLPAVVVIALDGSASMSSADRDRAAAAAAALVDRLELEARPQVQVAVVGFWDVGSYRCRPTNDAAHVRRCIQRLRRPEGGLVVHDLGLRQAYDAMADVAYGDRTGRLVVVFSNAGAPTECGAAQRSANRLTGRGARIIAACAGGTCDSVCMREVASSGSGFVPWTLLPRGWLSRVSLEEMDALHVVKPSRLTLTGTVPAGVDWLPGRVFPPPRSISPDGRTLEWRFTESDFVAARRLTVTVGLRPTRPGYQSLGLRAFADFVDSERRTRRFAIDEAWATVLGKP